MDYLLGDLLVCLVPKRDMEEGFRAEVGVETPVSEDETIAAALKTARRMKLVCVHCLCNLVTWRHG